MPGPAPQQMGRSIQYGMWLSQLISYADESIGLLLEKAAALGQPPAAESGQSTAERADLGPGLEHVLIREWEADKEEGPNGEEDGEMHNCPQQPVACVKLFAGDAMLSDLFTRPALGSAMIQIEWS